MKRVIYAIMLLTITAAMAADPHVGYVYPAGAQAGTKVRLLIGGQFLNGVRQGVISGDGVTFQKITLVPGFPFPDGKQRKFLLDWIKNIQSGNSAAPEKPEDTTAWRKNAWWEKLDQLDEMSLRLVHKNLLVRRNPLQASPAINQLMIVDLEIAADAAPGVRELRLWGNNGISAPNLFYIDNMPHVAEPEFTPPGTPQPAPPQVDQLPAVLDGQILPGETDLFKVKLEKGRPYTFALTGRKLHPFFGDAVPGHFQPVLRLLGPDGNEAAFADDEYFNPDPVMRFIAPVDGVYTLEIRDNLYRGREDFVYRVTLNPGIVPYQLAYTPFKDLPQATAGDLDAGKLSVANGVVRRPGDSVTYRLTGKAGQKFSCRVVARQCGSPLDAMLILKGPDGKMLIEADDSPSELNIGEIVQQVDPNFVVTLPADGEYRLILKDTTNAGGRDYRYWLRIGPPQPDFNVYAVKSKLNLSPHTKGKLKLFITREDGFAEKIELVSEDLILLENTVIPEDAAEFELNLRNPEKNNAKPRPVRIFAEATVNGVKIRKAVIPCEEFIQAFAYTHLLPVGELYLGTIPLRKNAKK